MASQGRSMALLVLVAFGLLSVVDRASAAEYKVGGDILGWIIPQPASYYTDWLAGKKFVVGDVLVFQYTPGAHTLLQLSAAAYPTCDLADPIKSLSTGDDKVTLDTAGDYYFVCGTSVHCSVGQKIKVTVSAKSGSPAPKPSPSKSITPTTAPSSASGLQAAGALVCSVFMVLVASLVL